MKSLRVVLIGIGSEERPALQVEFLAIRAVVLADVANAAEALEQIHLVDQEGIIVVARLRMDADFGELRHFIDHYPLWPVLVITAIPLDIPLMIRWMRAGVSQIVSLPLPQDDFRRAMERIVRRHGFQVNPGVVVAIAGASEGCGATTLGITFAADVAERLRKRTLLMELTPHMGRLAVALNSQPKFTTADFFPNLRSLDDTGILRSVTHVFERLMIMPAPYQTTESARFTAEDLEQCIFRLRQVVDVVVLDLPASFDDVYFKALEVADHLVLVGDQQVPSLHAMMVVRETIEKRNIRATQHLVINRFGEDRPGATLREIEQALRHAHFRTVAFDEEGVLSACNNGEPIQKTSPRSPVVHDVQGLVSQVMGLVYTAGPTRSEGFLHRLGHALGIE